MGNVGRTGIGSLLLFLVVGWLQLGGLYHSATAHSGIDLAVAFFVPPWAWYRSVEYFWHDTSPQSSSLVDSERLVRRYDIDRERAELLSGLVARYVEEIGGPEAYRDVLLKIGAQPSPHSIMQHSGFLMMRGAVRMGGSGVDSLAALRSELFSRFAPERCESLVGASSDPSTGWRFFAALDSAYLAGFFGFAAAATRAVITETDAPPHFDRSRYVSAMRSFYAMLGPPEQDRFVRFLDAPVKTKEEECWFQGRLWALLPDLPEKDARIILWQLGTNELGQ